MQKLNNTKINSCLFIHRTRTLYAIFGAIITWILLTTAVTYFAINSKFFHNQYQCEVAQFEPIKPASSHEPDKLVNKISAIYKIPKAKAYEILGIVKGYTRQGWPDTKTVLAVIATESAFDQHAVSSANAKGYMQVLAASGKPVTHEPYQNIKSGTELLRDYYRELGDKQAALQSYNIGITAFKSGRRAPEYLNKVNRNLQNFSSI